ncbi:hypothetical protein J5N97_017043 [Dioscorea zingiberensis]|uniref:Uncharacterized protein n=1 Tax=Dioscorea zingiberensis TaxID=325984 RepID=A0A9D5HG76_9LILI|nr:hypothetical protein J5N97_017043 [Dioscorea zingiberensis]
MASQEVTSKFRPPSAVNYPKGTDMELLVISGDPTNLYVLSSHRFSSESQAFRSGDLAVHLMKLTADPICMATCMVGAHQWMLTKDSLVHRLDIRTFLIAQPGFLYGVSLPCSSTDKETNKFQDILMRFTDYVDLVGKQSHGFSVTKRGIRTSGLERMVERAVRTSAVVKLVSRALLAGTLDPNRHLQLVFHKEERSNISSSCCYHLSMSTMKDLLSAMEAGNELMIHHPAVEGCWRLNQHGLMMLLKIMSLYTRVAVARNGDNFPAKKPKLDDIVEE